MGRDISMRELRIPVKHTLPPTARAKTVLAVRDLTEAAYVLRFERGGFDFVPGQYLSIGIPGEFPVRDYSIYSPPDRPYLEVLVREVPGGDLSPRLRKLAPGDAIAVEGPFGFFTIPADFTGPVFCVASGTGIAPFHSIALSNPERGPFVVHGVRLLRERYGHGDFPAGSVVSCVSGEAGGDIRGRVTDYLRGRAREGSLPETALYFLSGNCDMIYDAYDILASAGIAADRIRTEVFF